MRLRLFDRIRRLAHSRRPPAEAVPGVSGAQGRHRRRRGGPATVPGPPSPDGGPDPARGRPPGLAGGPAPGGPPVELTHTAAPWSGGSPAPEASAPPARPADPAPAGPAGAWPGRPPPGPRHGTGPGPGPGAVRAGAARARIREAPQEATRPVSAAPAPRARWQEAAEPAAAAARAEARADELARVAAGVPRQPDGLGRSSWRPAVPLSQSGLPYTAAHPREQSRIGDGRRHCGSLEAILWRQWDPASPPSREVVMAVDRLAELPFRIKEKLADGLDAIFIGEGGVPELDDMTSLRGVTLPAGRATWDACAGAGQCGRARPGRGRRPASA